MRTPRFFSFASLPFPLLSLALATGLLLTVSGSGCGTDRACFYWSDLEGACPSQGEALDFFQGDFCSSSISSVDSEGTFEGDTCCYDVSEDSSSFGNCTEPTPFPPGGPSVAVGVGGAPATGGFGGIGGGTGGVAGGGGFGGAGGGGTCASCKQFLLDEMPPELCPASVPLYEAFTDCKCLGTCAAVCGEACMSSQVPGTECENCLLDTSSNGCGMQFFACSNDGN
ncbi:hypothetical protein [Polyangium sp. 6x1]|uniref:hypothetical protein n=1 Tax=Polyangium sp. 6x1 TaxID=3042689 RepID=UPI00248319B4|nr:hypothetical protein [Polyangium sp. 6x1]MDI1449944.1 hypothetical protein [Polyangium sp. 6x1]